jgi:hypothetical protein
VPAPLRHHLILEVNRADPGGLVFTHGPDHVDRVTVAGVGVGDHRDVDRLRDPVRVVDHLRKRHQADVGAAKPRGGAAEPGHVRGRESGLLDQPRSESVVAARGQHHLAGLEPLAQTRGRARI